jgi:hypothetical protein
MGKASRKKQHPSHPPHASSKLPSMSGVLIDLVAPLYDADNTSLDEYHAMVGMGAVAWNVAQFPKDQRGPQLLAFFRAGSGFDLSFDEIIAAGSNEEVTAEPYPDMNVVDLIKSLAHRKDQLFPDDRRILMEWDVFAEKGTFRVTTSYRQPPAE